MDNWGKVFFDNIPAYLLIINSSLSIRFQATPLKQYVRLLGGYAFKSSEYKDTGIPIIRISDFQNEKIVLQKAVHYNESEEFERYELKSGDIIIALTGGTIGKLAIVQSGLGKLYLNQRVAKFQVLDINKIADEYVYWIARGVQDNVKKLAWGGAQPNVSSKQIEEMNFPIPDIDTQFQIIEFINDLKDKSLKSKVYFCQSVEEKILTLQETTLKIFEFYSEQEKQADIISQLKQAILQEAIAGQLTAEWRTQNPMQKGNPDTDAATLLAKIKAEKQQLIAEGKLKKEKPLAEIAIDEIPFSLPDSWVWCRLGESVNNIADIDHKMPNEVSDGIPYISPRDFYGNNQINFEQAKKISGEDYNNLSKKVKPEKYDIIFPRYGTIGVCRYIDFDKIFLASYSCVTIKTNKSFTSPKYVFYYCISPFSKIEIARYTLKTTQPNVGIISIKHFLFPLPPLAEQKAIAQKVDRLMETIDQLEQQIKHRKQLAEDLLQTVLREAFE